MNIKLNLGEVRLLIDKKYPIGQISTQLQPIAKKAGIIFADHQVGAGYLQWSLQGNNWTSFSSGTDAQKSVVAQLYKDRKNKMQESLQGSLLKDLIFSVPSEDFIYFRQNGDNWDIALTAWGYKYLDKVATTELDILISKKILQTVNVGFSWAGKTLSDFSFKLSGHSRITSSDGLFHIDGQLPVGSSYQIETQTGRDFTLLVEKGKENYVFDLTDYFQIEITVCQDNMPVPNVPCDLEFNGHRESMFTNQAGLAHLQLPFVNDMLGQPLVPQPQCSVTCKSESQEKIPSKEKNSLSFVYNFKTEVPEPPISTTKERKVQVKIEVFKGGSPVADKSCEIQFEGNTQMVNTDENGTAILNLTVKEQDGHLEKLLPCEVLCGGERQTKDVDDNTTSLYFKFEIPTKETPVKEQEYVCIQLKDYGGKPLVDMPFNLTIKKKNRIELKTDSEGKCKVPKDWFTSKEKMKIDFVVSTEYQKSHDIHEKIKQ